MLGKVTLDEHVIHIYKTLMVLFPKLKVIKDTFFPVICVKLAPDNRMLGGAPGGWGGGGGGRGGGTCPKFGYRL